MTALILNSGMGSRMGELTKDQPKAMIQLSGGNTVLSRQINQLEACGISKAVITTGYFPHLIEEHAHRLSDKIEFVFINNPLFSCTNYIYSIFLAADYLSDDILLLHGDLVFSADVLREALDFPFSCMTVSSCTPLPDKDFKAVISDKKICAVGVEFFENAVAAQPLYKILKSDWLMWLNEIKNFVLRGETKCYAEDALNKISMNCNIKPLDIEGRLCSEIDTSEDVEQINFRLLNDEVVI